MKVEPAEQFARAARPHGYGGSAEALVQEYAPLVRKIAWQVFSKVARSSELDDLIQVGLIALIEASRQYEERGFAFSTYATTRIRGAMIDQLRREADVAAQRWARPNGCRRRARRSNSSSCARRPQSKWPKRST